jgi:peroxiredoxin Q/BCP
MYTKNMQEGESAPDFELPASDGSTVKLSSFKGDKNVVLCFYPKNHLFMCPSKKVFKMAQSTVSAYSDILKTGSVLFAISVDTVDDQKKFVSEYQIPYLHLSDVQKNVCKQYAGLNMAGLAKRSTFIIDKNGTIRKIFRDFDVEKHGQQVAQTLASLT